MQTTGVTLSSQQCLGDSSKSKRCSTDSEAFENCRKSHHLSQESLDWPAAESKATSHSPQHPPQVPSPSLTGNPQGNISPSASGVTAKRKPGSLDFATVPKRQRLFAEPVHAPSSIDEWLLKLPEDSGFVHLDNNEGSENMSQPPSKRFRSTDSLDGRFSQSGDGSASVVSRDKKYSVYRDANYSVVLETKGSFMHPSKLGMVDEDKELCEKLLTSIQTMPPDTLFDGEHFIPFLSNLRGRSEARICIDLHPRMMPSVENLNLCGRQEFEGIIEGHNDAWIKSIPFYGPRPQPDHTYAFKWSNFDEQQRRKLNIEPTKKSYYTAREDMFFPFLTGEIKCGKEGLDLADKPNAHSMTIALRGVVDLYRRLQRPHEVHRRVLGFTISHDDSGARMYAHYPEIDGERETFWRETLGKITFEDNKGERRRECSQFTLNVCQLFAPLFLKRLKSLIDELPDPATQSFGLTTTFDAISAENTQDESSAVGSQEENISRPSTNRGLNAELRSVIQSLQRQLEQQRQDSERQRQDSERHREDMKTRETELIAQLETQREKSERLMEMLERQGEQIQQLLRQQQ